MEKIVDIIESIANEKDLNLEDVKQRVLTAFENSAKKLNGFDCNYQAMIDFPTKSVKVYQKIEVIKNDDERAEDENRFLPISKAKELDSNAEIGDELTYEIDIESYGRTAASTLSKELDFQIRKLVEEKIYEKYNQKIGDIVSGIVIRVDEDSTTFIELNEQSDIVTLMPIKNRIKGEIFKKGDHLKAVIRKVFLDKYGNVKVEISRTSPKFLEALLKMEVPEIAEGKVIIHSSARIPGERAKIALTSVSPSVDAIGSTIGTKGIRINAVSKELNGENIDAIEYSNNPEIFVARAMSPAIVKSVKIEERTEEISKWKKIEIKKATVYISSEQKSKAIGKSGINIRLASMLTGYEIELSEDAQASNQNNENGFENLKALFGDL